MHEQYLGVVALVFLVAALYSSVGHGGASGYLAVLSILAFPTSEIKATALILNIVVAGMAFVTFARARHFVLALIWPFLLTSIPAAFLGAMIQVSGRMYFVLLALALLASAVRLCIRVGCNGSELRPLNFPLALLAGAAIGMISGMIGIGGGIFLSPLLIMLRWSDAKTASATSAAFIVANSLVGLAGHATHTTIHLQSFLPLMAAATVGGLIGSNWGANRLSGLAISRSLAVVLLLAAGKLVITALGV